VKKVWEIQEETDMPNIGVQGIAAGAEDPDSECSGGET
jgi:hypothetical protein